jgi:hypothetical protein
MVLKAQKYYLKNRAIYCPIFFSSLCQMATANINKIKIEKYLQTQMFICDDEAIVNKI